MRIGSLCSGVGGLDLGLEDAGMEIAWHAETDPHAAAVLEKRWPGVPNVGDLKGALAQSRPLQVDVLAGGIPCQPASQAGRRAGTDDDRWLWPAARELVKALTPRIVLIENVAGLLTVQDGEPFGEILTDFHALGYSVEWDHLPACAVGAPHRRDRVFIIARRDGRLTWTGVEEACLFAGLNLGGRWTRAGRWDGRLHVREPRWPVKGGAWPTPTAKACNRSLDAFDRTGRPQSNQSLQQAAWRCQRQWATPDAGLFNDSEKDLDKWAERREEMRQRHGNGNGNGCGMPLGVQVRQTWPTPTVSSGDQWADDTTEGQTGGTTLGGAVRGNRGNSGRLNPGWAETLMGWPIGWTDLDCDEPVSAPGWPAGEWPTPQAQDALHSPENLPNRIAQGRQVQLAHVAGWPAPPGPHQHPWEPPRLTERKDQRRHRLRCVGNGVVRQVAATIGRAIMDSLA